MSKKIVSPEIARDQAAKDQRARDETRDETVERPEPRDTENWWLPILLTLLITLAALAFVFWHLRPGDEGILSYDGREEARQEVGEEIAAPDPASLQEDIDDETDDQTDDQTDENLSPPPTPPLPETAAPPPD